jgi:methylated-DNA-[protein]-cysteine S-methyltransferase
MTLETPLGPFTVLVREGAVVASGFTAQPADGPRAPAVADAVRAYFDGDLEAIDAVPVLQRSGPFREAVWAALRATPPGAPTTYAELARRCGRPAAARAAGAACASNACSLFVPCHRAVRGDGGLGGFLWGLPVKRRLLAHEGG